MNQYSAEKKPKKATKTKKPTEAKKTEKSTTTRSKAKGGNILGTVGELVAPSGWETFATAAGLFALDRADAALRRGTKEKKEKMKGGKNMTGGLCPERQPGQFQQVIIGARKYNTNGKPTLEPTGSLYEYFNRQNKPFQNYYDYQQLKNNYNWPNQDQMIVIKCNKDGKYYYEVNIQCDDDVKTYVHLPKINNKKNNKTDPKYFFDTFEEAERIAKVPKIQVSLVKLALLDVCKKKSNS
jgi:hypothetical protein